MGRQPLIFVSIASYRDPQLVPTIEDCLAKAARPENLRFGICWQRDAEEPALPFAGDPRFRILDVDWRESRGCCWARAQVMSVFDGEDWFLQLDAHHRFAPHWDSRLLAQVERTGAEKPILTGYTPSFKLDDPNSFGNVPLQTDFKGFEAGGLPDLFESSPIIDWPHRTHPVRARFVTAGFLFASGRFVTDVPYDAELYFWGEEISLSIRAFTHGYDFFHPTEIVLWHLYATDRIDRHLHWDDHGEHNGVAITWDVLDRSSRVKVARLLCQPFVGPFGCGGERTLAAYEAFIGVSFQHQAVSDYTQRHLEPPNPPMRADWAQRLTPYDVLISFDKTRLRPDVEVLNVTFRDGEEKDIVSLTGDRHEVRALTMQPGSVGTLRRAFRTDREPVGWTLAAYTKSAGWLRPFYGTLFSGARRVNEVKQESAA